MTKNSTPRKRPKILLVLSGLVGVLFLMAFAWPQPVPPASYDENSPLSEVLIALGDDKPLHYTSKRDAELVRMGEEIVTLGRTKGPDGKMSRRQSKYFVCADCHNTKQEDPDIKNPNPEGRLDYAVKNGIPFLQGTTLWGIVNRETWYNDDYLLKYGDLVSSSRDTLMNAIDLCSIECSQGRYLDDWEKEAMMAYLYSIELKMSDLKFTDEQYKELNELVVSSDDVTKDEAISWMKQQFMTKSPATFLYPPSKEHRPMGKDGDAANGKLIYDSGCMHCHDQSRVTNFILDNSKLTFNMLDNHLGKQTHYSLYEIARSGTHAMPGYRPYMPHYTEERMSKQQLEDLVAYIKQQAN